MKSSVTPIPINLLQNFTHLNILLTFDYFPKNQLIKNNTPTRYIQDLKKENSSFLTDLIKQIFPVSAIF